MPCATAEQGNKALDAAAAPTGFSLAETLVVMSVVAVLASIVAPQLQESVSHYAVDVAAGTFTARLSLARAIAVREGSQARLELDVNASRFLVTVDTTTDGSGVWDTVGVVVDISDANINISSADSVFCFAPRGLATGGSPCASGETFIVFARGNFADTVRLTTLGKVLR